MERSIWWKMPPLVMILHRRKSSWKGISSLHIVSVSINIVGKRTAFIICMIYIGLVGQNISVCRSSFTYLLLCSGRGNSTSGPGGRYYYLHTYIHTTTAKTSFVTELNIQIVSCIIFLCIKLNVLGFQICCKNIWICK